MKVNFIACIPGTHEPIYETEDLFFLPRPGDYVQTPKGEGEVHSVTFLVDPPTGESEVAILLKMSGMN